MGGDGGLKGGGRGGIERGGGLMSQQNYLQLHFFLTHD